MISLSAEAARFHRLVQELTGQRVLVLGHVRPDGDCIGSQVALVRILRALGCDALAVNHHPIPRNCQAFVQDTPFLANCTKLPPHDRLITVDCAERDRIGLLLNNPPVSVFLAVDHHLSNGSFAEHNFVYPELSATTEVLARFCFAAGLPCDAVTAQALYIGIATDTGQFRYSSTTADVLRLAAELVTRGADAAAASYELYENESRAKLALLQRFLASLEYHCQGRVCIGSLYQEDWRCTGAQKEDTEGLVDYARSIAGVEIGILLEERTDGTKGSFRAKQAHHRVDLLAKSFHGGGHACAAGFNPKMSLLELRPLLLERLDRHFQDLDRTPLSHL